MTFLSELLDMDTPAIADIAKTNTYKLCADTEGCQEDLPRTMTNSDKWREKLKEIPWLDDSDYNVSA